MESLLRQLWYGCVRAHVQRQRRLSAASAATTLPRATVRTQRQTLCKYPVMQRSRRKLIVEHDVSLYMCHSAATQT